MIPHNTAMAVATAEITVSPAEPQVTAPAAMEEAATAQESRWMVICIVLRLE